MANADALYVREREVEAARSKLAADLAILSSPATFTAFTDDLKTDATNLKDEALAKAKNSAQATFQGVVNDIKARAAENPAAVLAIGAGIAWHLVRHPPITTALIGAGLYSLFKTTPSSRSHDGDSFLSEARDRLSEQVSEFAVATKEKAQEVGEAVANKTSKLTSRVVDSIAEASQSAAEKIAESASAASDRAQEWRETAQTSVGGFVDDAKAALRGGSPATFGSHSIQQSWSPSLQPAQPSRDTLLLGVAGAAVAAAVGIALQRRMSEADQDP